MKTIRDYINESLDIENLFWKIDTWFTNRDEAKNQFIDLVSLYKTKKANKQEIETWVLDNNINIQEFVNFLDEDVTPNKSTDYIYQLCKIIDLINANKSYTLKKNETNNTISK